jgi:DNA ligase 1
MLGEYPAFVRLYDILFDGGEDLRGLPWTERARLEPSCRGSIRALRPVAADRGRDFEHLEELRAGARDAAIEGLMLKRRDSPYVPGAEPGLWYKWKRDPLTADCVLMYAQRGSGKRSSYYSDYTFGCWTEDGRAAPGRQGLFRLHRRGASLARPLGPQPHGRAVRPGARGRKALVLEVAFDSIHASTRHKSGLAMRFPRISRIRTDKPAATRPTAIETLLAMVT